MYQRNSARSETSTNNTTSWAEEQLSRHKAAATFHMYQAYVRQTIPPASLNIYPRHAA